jgi:PAS domain S-box-containing protein
MPIQSKKKVAESTSEVTLGTARDFAFKAGQYIRVTLPNLPAETPGGNTRDFTISSSPNKKGSITISFRNSNSVFKTSFLSALPGTKVMVQGPLGVFTLPKSPEIPLVFIAGGIGVTAFLSMIRYLAESKIPQRVALVYVNSSARRAAYQKELQAIAKTNPSVTLVDSTEHIGAEFIKRHIKYSPRTVWYICGPPQMILDLAKMLPQQLGVEESNIRSEEYVGYDKTVTDYKVLQPVERAIRGLTDNEALQMAGRSLLMSASQAALIAITDIQGTIRYVNQKFIEVSQYSWENLIGQNHRILKSGYHTPAFYQTLWKTISGGKMWRGDIKNRAKDGSFYWVDTSITPIFEDKAVVGYMAVRFLITDRKAAEQELLLQGEATLSILEDVEKSTGDLEKSNEELKKLVLAVDNLNELVYIANPATLAPEYVNPAVSKIYGYSQDQFLARPAIWARAIHPDDKNRVLRHFKALQKSKKSGRTEYRIIRKDGAIRWVIDSSTWLHVKSGRAGHMIGVLYDVTQLKQAEQARNMIFVNTSHELKTPIVPILIQAEMLKKGELGTLTAQQKESVELILRNMLRLARLINDLMEISRIQAGGLALSLQLVNLRHLVASEIAKFKPIAEGKGVKLRGDVSDLHVTCDENRIKQVLTNLIDNALKFTRKGSITITARRKGGIAVIRVTDTGIGIKKANISRLFSPFTQLKHSYEVKKTGTGLGLSISKSLVESHNGKIWVESPGEGKGSSFIFTLPLGNSSVSKGLKRNQVKRK